MLRVQLSKDVLYGAKIDSTPIEDAISYLLDFGWLHKCQEREACDSGVKESDSQIKQENSDQKPLMLPLTYEEFKLTKSSQMENLEIITKYLRPMLTTYAVERSRYNIV